MKSRSIIILILLLFIFGVIWWCKSPRMEDSRQNAIDKITPNINVTKVTITEISHDQVKMNCRIVLDNPLLVNINTTRISYDIFIDSVQVLQSEYSEPLIIRSGDTSFIELQLSLDAESLTNVLKHFDVNNVDSAEYSIQAILEVDVPIAGEKQIKMTFSRKLPAVKVPKVELVKLDLNLLQLRKKGVDIVLSVENPNEFEIHLYNAKFNFYIDDYFTLQGIPDPDIVLAPGSTNEIAVNADIQDSKLTKTAWDLLIKKDAPFSLHFSGILRSENNMLDQSKLNLVVNGRMDEIRDIMKRIKSQ